LSGAGAVRATVRRSAGSATARDVIDPIVLVPLADTMRPVIAQHEGPGHPFFHAPSVDLSMRFFADTGGEWFLTKMIGHWAGDGCASAEIAMWDEDRRLVAHAVQMMLIRFPTRGQLRLT
jgi:acyl-CoA thioesterase